MSDKKKYDLIVIGAGPGGYVASIVAAQKGMKVANIEKRKTLGGTCLNVGCIPSKALLHASEQYKNNLKENANHNWGIEFDNLKLNLEKLMKKKLGIVDDLTKGINFLFNKNKIDRFIGQAKILKNNEVSVTKEGKKETIYGEKIIIASGSKPSSLKNIGFDEQLIVSSTGVLELNKIPKKLVVVGAGVIGLEMGTVWQRFGSDVEIIEFMPRILNGMDSEISQKFMKILENQGIKFQLNTSVEEVLVKDNFAQLKIKNQSDMNEKLITADIVLIAVGREPNTENLGLKELGISLDEKGFIETDEKFQTSIKNIYAIGDVIKGPMLAHKAEEDGVALVELINNEAGHVDYNLVPNIIYTSPEVASIGSTEDYLLENKITYNKGTFPFSANSRAKAIGHTEGIVKILSDKQTDKILGAHIIGHEAGTIIHELSMAMGFGASSEDVARICHGHPTVNEAIKEAALATFSRAIHS